MAGPETTRSDEPVVAYRRGDDGALTVVVGGAWLLSGCRPALRRLDQELDSGAPPAHVGFDASELTRWDSTFVAFVTAVRERCSTRGLDVRLDALPTGLLQLLELSAAVPELEADGTGRSRKPPSALAKVGLATLSVWHSAAETVGFVGEVTLAAGSFAAGRARFRWADLALTIQQSGPGALPIITTITLLSGLILAFVGSLQLRMFGAQIYVADLVGIGIVREMGAIMTAVVMAGRTGAAFAAQLGTMQVNEELDAFRTMGISPVEFLVLPRIVGLTLMMPLLCLYADLMGILGGLIVGVGVLDLSLTEYLIQTRDAITLNDLGVGLFMGLVFGVLIGLAGCLQGVRCGRSSSAVGEATTAAVVSSIVSIVVATALITVMCDVLGI